MKLSGLNINSYKHLKNLDFDFTYSIPRNPLDKICIIGQSATGKTNILELIKDAFRALSKVEIIEGKYLFTREAVGFDGVVEFSYEDSLVSYSDNRIVQDGLVFEYGNSGGGAVAKLLPDPLRLLYLTSELISKESLSIFDQNPIDILNSLPEEQKREMSWTRSRHSYQFEFVRDVNRSIWLNLLYEILEYRKKFTQMASELINKGTIGDFNRLNKEYEKWSKENKNPLLPFAGVFNPILKRLNLEVDLINTEYPIPIKTKISDDVVPVSDLSTGTKGLLLSMVPLYGLNTDDAIIIIDEPERSLFPDIQIDLIKHYKELAPNAQLIVATHSPFIAAAFEPEERFILYFDAEGKVAVRRGESPIGDDPNDILRNDFNVDFYNEFGKQAYQRYLALKQKIVQETEPEEKKRLLIEMTELGDKYNF